MENYNNVEERLYDAFVNDDECMAFSYTEYKVQIDKDGKWKTVCDSETEKSMLKKASAASRPQNVAYGDNSLGCNSNFIMYTYVTRGLQSYSNNRRKYYCYTSGDWLKNAIWGGEKYPATGNDFVLQSVPSGFSMESDSLTVDYTNGYKAVNGTDYYRCNGGATYIKYSVKDDPVGNTQMDDFLLKSECIAKINSGRTICSYYVHTWKSLSISVSASIDSEKKTSLDITPSVNDKSVELYSYVKFDF